MTLLLLLAACCGGAPPRWTAIDPVTVSEGVQLRVDLLQYLDDDDDGPWTFSASAERGAEVAVDGSTLVISGATQFEGYSRVTVEAEDACGQVGSTNISVEVVPAGTELPEGCTVELRYTGTAGTVSVAGAFNEWSTTANVMDKDAGGFYARLFLAPGDYPYKLVIDGAWSCDPARDTWLCEQGQAWDEACTPGGNSCNSLLRVADCAKPRVDVQSVRIDREGGQLQVLGEGAGDVTGTWATLDGEPVEAWDDNHLAFDSNSVVPGGLAPGRHVFRAGADGAEEVYVPAWIDAGGWDRPLYFAFVDRFADGDPGNNAAVGATVDWHGGDWQGVIDHLDDLVDLGVGAIWLTAPVDNPDGAWAGHCNATYAAYHGYWPASDGLEEHFGDDAKLRELVAAAHARGLRVMVDWVANHVHQDHTWWSSHAEWFNEPFICEQDEDGDGVSNWNQRPETCWFAPYLPDIDYGQVEPSTAMVDAAIDFAIDYEIDGYRVDAVKHMPHHVVANLQSAIRARIEHTDAGGDEDFRTVGETFDGMSTIAAYISPHQLDAQFDFPLYYAIVAAFARDEVGLSDGDSSVRATLAQSRAGYGGARMGTFLGNHDVERFLAHAAGRVTNLYGDGACGGDGNLKPSDLPPGWGEPNQRLALAFAFLFTTEGQPLVYYGDEIGLPGFADPDNRQPMRFESLSDDESRVRQTVARLAGARAEHPAFYRGTRVEWWDNEPDLWAYARVDGDDAMLAILNRADSSRVVQNGVDWAGLPRGTYVDVLDGSEWSTMDDILAVEVPALAARVLVPR